MAGCITGRIRAAVPHARLLHDLRPVPRQCHRPRLAHLSRPQGRALLLFLSAVDDDPVRVQGARHHRRRRRHGSRAALSAVADRSVRHALVHLSAADLLRLREADQARAVAGHLARRRRARNLACRDRLDGAGRVRRPLRLFLHRLYRRPSHLRAHRAGAEASPGSALAGLIGLGRVQRHHGASRLRRAAVLFARHGPDRRRRGRHRFLAAGAA